jgi:hypothetical protein
MVHVRRKFFDEAERTGSPIAHEAVKRIAKLYAIEKEIKGKSPEERAAMRQAQSKPIFDELELWLQAQLRKISGKTKLAEAIRYALNRMPKARGYLDDGRLELDNNTCERSIRPIALGRKKLSIHGVNRRRQGSRHRLHARRDCKDEQRRSRSMAHLGPPATARSQDQSHR